MDNGNGNGDGGGIKRGDKLTAGTVSISDLIEQCNEAIRHMSGNNPHKLLLFNCGMALRQLADRLYEKDEKRIGIRI